LNLLLFNVETNFYFFFLVQEQTGEVLKRAGINVLLGSLSKMGAFFAAVIIPIPALRILALQVGCFDMISLLLHNW
jgi:patched 1 protein